MCYNSISAPEGRNNFLTHQNDCNAYIYISYEAKCLLFEKISKNQFLDLGAPSKTLQRRKPFDLFMSKLSSNKLHKPISETILNMISYFDVTDVIITMEF